MAVLRCSASSTRGFVPGSNPRIDESLQRRGPIEDFLRQPADALCSFSDAIGDLGAL